MSETDTTQQRPRSNFASRMLTKELNVRNKTSQQMKISPADAAKFANPEEAKKEESVTIA